MYTGKIYFWLILRVKRGQKNYQKRIKISRTFHLDFVLDDVFDFSPIKGPITQV